ncbi:MAG: hypothetical protein CME65_04845 [Halobacteriovoraceae bacterium]|nr:hypothetical protein [Halobacteriovoraceae bacterium]|tara:strand:- start:7982 stop:8458 length:477 start_codon:yes stop_codon:yes gene_type:complete
MRVKIKKLWPVIAGLFLFFAIQPAKASDTSLKNFESDYCTYFPEGTLEKPDLWKSCCFDHDLRYWFGGSSADMLMADNKLRNCVTQKAGSFYGNLMYYGVRAGHFSPVKNERKWSWGWNFERAFKPLDPQEKKIINHALNELNLDREYLKAFKKFYSL